MRRERAGGQADHIGLPGSARILPLIPDSGIVVLRGPLASGIRSVAAGWSARQRAAGHRVRGISLGEYFDADCLVLDLLPDPDPVEGQLVVLRDLCHRVADGDLRAVMILTRAPLGATGDGMGGGVIPTEIGPSDLRLTSDELREMLEARDIATDHAHALFRELTGGWLRLVPPALAALSDEPALSTREVQGAFDRQLLAAMTSLTAALAPREIGLLSQFPAWDVDTVRLADRSYTRTTARELLRRAENAGFLWRESALEEVLHTVRPLVAAFRRQAGGVESLIVV